MCGTSPSFGVGGALDKAAVNGHAIRELLLVIVDWAAWHLGCLQYLDPMLSRVCL